MIALLDRDSAYLLRNQNPNAPERDDGLRYWGYPTRKGRTVTRVVIHTAEIDSDLDPPDLTAERIGQYFSRTTTPSSYHVCGDTDGPRLLLPADHVAFGAVGHNLVGWHFSFATRAAMWSSLPASAVDAYLRHGAPVVAAALDLFGLPTRRLTNAQAQDVGAQGICGHYQTDPTRRTDPGAGFPWDRFVRMVDDHRSITVTEQHPHPNPKVPEFPSWLDHIKTMVGYGSMTAHTVEHPADIVTSGQLAAYLVGLLDGGRLPTEEEVAWQRREREMLLALDPPSNAGALAQAVEHLREVRAGGGAMTQRQGAALEQRLGEEVAALADQVAALGARVQALEDATRVDVEAVARAVAPLLQVDVQADATVTVPDPD